MIVIRNESERLVISFYYLNISWRIKRKDYYVYKNKYVKGLYLGQP
jgi:hypothetical protein